MKICSDQKFYTKIKIVWDGQKKNKKTVNCREKLKKIWFDDKDESSIKILP